MRTTVGLRADGSWSPGTFATTEEDAKNVKTGTEAVARYALPNPAPASYVFTGKPKKDTVIQRGFAQPAYGQPGGCVEVYFKDGTQPNTVTGPWSRQDPRRMRIKLEHRFVERLSNLPESGMGYQRVDIRLSDGRELKDVVVFNAEEADVPDEFAQAKITDVRLHAA